MSYTDDQIRDFHAQYIKLGNVSIPSFAKGLGIKPNLLWRKFNKLGLKIIPQSVVRRKFPIDENFFEVIDTEEKAYILGFIFADGCNFESGHNIVISLEKGDVDILRTISRILLFGNVHVKINEKKNEARLDLINRKLSDDLKKLGGVARKTFVIKFPEIAFHLHHHFIRGYFDGDGMLTFSQRPGSSYKGFDFSITSTAEMVGAIKTKIESLGIHVSLSKRHKNRDNNNFTIRVSGNQQIKTVCDYLYYDATIFLPRKHKIYLELVDYSKLFRVSDKEFLDAYHELQDIKLLAAKLGIDRKTVKRRIKKLGLA